MKKRLFLLHTMPFVMETIVGPLQRAFQAQHPDVDVQTMLDTSLLADTMAHGSVDPVTADRLLAYAREAERAGGSLLLLTCTSMGEAMPYVDQHVSMPTLRITDPMVREALDLGTRIGIVGTVPTAPAQIIQPLLAEAERRGLRREDLTIVTVVCEDAFAARRAGDTAAHDRIVSEATKRLAAEHALDAICFAQASMTAAVFDDPGVPVLVLGPSAFAEASRMLG